MTKPKQTDDPDLVKTAVRLIVEYEDQQGWDVEVLETLGLSAKVYEIVLPHGKVVWYVLGESEDARWMLYHDKFGGHRVMYLGD